MLSSFIAVDTETTGLDYEHDRVIEIAAVRFEAGRPVADFEALISPGRSLSPVSRLITGLDEKQLEAAPPAAETWRAFLDFAGAAPLVAHNAEFDAHFVRRALEAGGLAASIPAMGAWLDSLLLSRIAWPAWESHRLDSLAERLRVPRDAEHRALPDARRAGFVFLAAQAHVRRQASPGAWDDLARLSAALPDWSLVFHGRKEETTGEEEGRDGAASPSLIGDAAAGGEDGTGEEHKDGIAEAATAVADALLSEAWLALETPPELDENLAGLRAALQAAGSGQRVLLAVPDLHTWNTLRKSAHAARSRAKGAGSPALKALAEPSGYACRARLQALARDPARLPAEERAALLPLIAWADRHAAGPVADGRGFSPERARLLWSRVCCDAWSDDPAAQAARDEAAAAGVILVTHAALCAHAALEGALLPACDSVIVTGAHRFPDIAQSPAGAGRAASFFRLREALQLLRLSPERDEGIWNDLPPLPAGDEGKNEWKSRWFEPERQLQKFLQKAGRHAAKPASGGGDFRVRYTEPAALAFGADPAPVLEALKENEDFLQACAGACTSEDAASSGGIRRAVQRVEARLRAFRTDFQSLCDARDAESVYWFEDVANPHKATLRAAPRDMEPFGDALRALFGGGAFVAPALLSGAQAPRDARWFLRAAGLTAPEPPVAVRRLPPREPAHGPRFLMTPSAPFLGSGDQAADFARFLAEAAGPFADRGVLVLCPSQTALRSLHAALRKEWGRAFPLWAQHADGNRDALLRLYASGRGGCVLSAEGLPGLRDADGRAPALWVVARMPLPPPRDPLLEARGEVLREEGRNARLELWHPAAILRVKREWSVLCRSGSRPEAVWLLDGRAAAEGLGARLAGALGCGAVVVRDTAELQNMTASVDNGQWTVGSEAPS